MSRFQSNAHIRGVQKSVESQDLFFVFAVYRRHAYEAKANSGHNACSSGTTSRQKYLVFKNKSVFSFEEYLLSF